ncbi:MAG: ABC transporter ATP-binding protein/permease [Eubacterium sp.]|nr:ABC transporter ATP-binding protein/permease [Eubacterium sp.]
MKKISYITIVWKIFITALVAAPLWILLDCAAMLLSSVCYAFSTVVKQWLFDTITEVVAGKTTYSALLFVSLCVVLFQIGNELLNAVCNFTWSPAMKSIVGKLKQKIHRKIAKIPGNLFEDVRILECIEKAGMGADKCYSLYNSVATILLFYLPYFLVLGIYLWKLKPILILALFFVFLPLTINLFLRQKIFEKQLDETVPLQREKDYYETELFSRETCKENRLYGSFSFFFNKYTSVNNLYCETKWKAAKRAGIVDFGMRSLTLAGYFGILLLLLYLMLDGSISVGAFAAVFSSITTLISFMNDAIGNHLGALFEQIPLLKKYLEFFELPEEPLDSEEIGWNEKIEVRHVSFSYPGTEKKVLEDISFEIKKGETIALVGENGAGKSTLVRILSGVLRPDEGEVLVDGTNLFSICQEERFRYVSAIFQQFIHYQMTLRENVEISATDFDFDKMRQCLEKSELLLDERFQNGYDTMLTSEFGGIELSGGQWQRVALARGLYKDNKMILLDEPTSAIDPIEEGILYRKFQNMIRGKMGILVTHRLGSVKIADRVLVLKEGKIVEQGSHEELMNNQGHYANLYREQEKWY